ncbi:MAG: SDR family oxidoreductase [Pseudomonadota bacterium]
MRKTVNELWTRWHRRHWRRSPATDLTIGLAPLVCITGGSSGIGRALAFEFARRGHALLLIARDPSALERTARAIRAESPGAEVHVHHTDLRHAANRQGLEAHAAALGYYIDVLVNAAGIGLSGPVVSHSVPETLDLIALNVDAVTDLTRKMLPGMLARGRGGVLTISSLAADVPGPFQATYYASKAFVSSFMAALAWEVRGHGVRVTDVSPGAVDTDFHAKMGAEGSAYLFPGARLSRERVAQAALSGFLAWRRRVVPGVAPKIACVAVHFAPRWAAAPIMALLLHPRRHPDGPRKSARREHVEKDKPDVRDLAEPQTDAD